MSKSVGRRYYLRIEDSFFKSEVGRFLSASAERDTFFVIYQKLLLRSGRNNGVVTYSADNPLLVDRLALQLHVKGDVLKRAVALFVKIGVAVEQGTSLFFPEARELVRSECESAERMRRHRKNKAALWSKNGYSSHGDAKP